MNSTVRWPDETLPVEADYVPEVLHDLEIAAVEGLRAMPRTGLGVGGLLYGSREGNRVEILGAKEIACSHAMGPSFVLTPEELEAAASLAAEDGDAEGDGARHELIGWYCSKTKGQMAMTDHDRMQFETLCPGQGRVALLMQPRRGSPTLAVFGFRSMGIAGRDGVVVFGATRELVWESETAPEPGAPVAVFEQAAPIPVAPPAPATAPPVIVEPVGEAPAVVADAAVKALPRKLAVPETPAVPEWMERISPRAEPMAAEPPPAEPATAEPVRAAPKLPEREPAVTRRVEPAPPEPTQVPNPPNVVNRPGPAPPPRTVPTFGMQQRYPPRGGKQETNWQLIILGGMLLLVVVSLLAFVIHNH